MKVQLRRPCALPLCVLVAFGAGCSFAPRTAGDLPQIAGSASRWMATDAVGRDLLYVSGGEIVEVYTYPRGKLVGLLGTGADFMCSDKYGYVFMPTAFGGGVVVYAHGATNPTTSLTDPYFPYACSVDPSTRNVAVTGNYGNLVMIFPYNKKRGWRFGKQHPNSAMRLAAFCGYDKKGNLFVDGTDLNGNFMLAELPKGSSTYETISVSQAFQKPGGVQWDGNYLTIADFGNGPNSSAAIYRFSISGSTATKVSSTRLADSYAGGQFWIEGSRIIGNISHDSVRAIGYWAFPGGGSPMKTFGSDAPFGVTVSLNSPGKW